MGQWWRVLVGIEPQSLAERTASENAASLFFGALIGANLGLIQDMPIRDYVLIVAILSMTVLYIQLITVGLRRLYYAINLAMVIALLWLVLMSPFADGIFTSGESPSAHLFWTIALWLATILTIHMRPVREDRPAA